MEPTTGMLLMKAGQTVKEKKGLIVTIALLLIIIFFLPIIFVISLLPSFPSNDSSPLNAEVLAYAPLVSAYCQEYNIPEFTNIILAIMMQESGGKLPDIMQSSECGLNHKYPRVRNGITDPEYSIEVGISYFKSCLLKAGCYSPADTATLYMALQGYNFGIGYINWAKALYGEYSKENAVEFSNIKLEELRKKGQNWERYGDVNYVDNVMRYVILTIGEADGELAYPLKEVRINCPWMGYTNHRGIDFKASVGTPVYASMDGTVSSTGFSGSWGLRIKLNHSDSVHTLYAHLSKSIVTVGQEVKQGDLIGYTGNTGNTTGPHLHFELYLGSGDPSNRVDPLPYLKGDKSLTS